MSIINLMAVDIYEKFKRARRDTNIIPTLRYVVESEPELRKIYDQDILVVRDGTVLFHHADDIEHALRIARENSYNCGWVVVGTIDDILSGNYQVAKPRW